MSEAYDPVHHQYPKCLYRPLDDDGRYESGVVADEEEEAARLNGGWFSSLGEATEKGAFARSQRAWERAMEPAVLPEATAESEAAAESEATEAESDNGRRRKRR